MSDCERPGNKYASGGGGGGVGGVGGRGTPLYKPYRVCAVPKGSCAVLVSKRVLTLPILV